MTVILQNKDVKQGSLSEETVKELEDILMRHYGEAVHPVSRYCKKLREYSQAINALADTNEELPEGEYRSYGVFHNEEELQLAARGLGTALFWAHKSNLLWRLLYNNETLRTRECPEHKGHWCGCQWPAPECCSVGHDVTGWVPHERTHTESDD
jgi:hypothetical protein